MDDTVVLERRLEPCELLDAGAAPHTLVGDDGFAAGEDGDHLAFEGSAVLRGGRALMRLRRILVEPGAGEPPLLRDHLGGDPLVEREIRIAGKDFRPVRLAGGARGAERNPTHHLDPACNDDVLLARHHRLHGEIQRLLARSAGAVDGGAGDGFRPPRGEDRVAADVARLVADLRYAAPDDVVDDFRVDTRTLHQRGEDEGGQVGGVHLGQSAVALADRRPDRFDNYRFTHSSSPFLTSDRPGRRPPARATPRCRPARIRSLQGRRPCVDPDQEQRPSADRIRR